MTKIAFSKAKKIAMKFFGSEMTPPPPFGNFPEIHPFWYTQASLMVMMIVVMMMMIMVMIMMTIENRSFILVIVC